MSQRLIGAISDAQIRRYVPKFDGDLRSHFNKILGPRSSFMVLSGTGNGESQIQWHRVDEGVPVPVEPVPVPRERIDALIRLHAKNANFPSGSFLLQRPTRHWEQINSGPIRSLIGVRRALGKPFSKRQWYLLLFDMGKGEKTMGNPQQALLAANTDAMVEYFCATAQRLELSLSRLRAPERMLALLPKAARIISFARNHRAPLAASWKKHLVQISEIEYGANRYDLRKPLVGLFCRKLEILAVEGFGSEFLTRGPSLSVALRRFFRECDRRYRMLRRTRPYRRRSAEEKQWRLLCSLINVESYEDGQPLEVRRVGTVVGTPTNESCTVEWENGSQLRVPLARAPAVFHGYGRGTRFEAAVAYHRRTHQLVAIRSCAKLEDFEFGKREAAEMWTRMRVLESDEAKEN